MNKRTAAVIGCGKYVDGKVGWAIGHEHANGYRNCGTEFELYGVDINQDNLDAFGARFGVPPENLFRSTEALYAHVVPEFVSICTWPGLHAPMVIDAARRGAKAIYCEKPMALNAGEIREMLAECKKAGAHLAIAHQRRFEPMFQRVKELIQSGALGEGIVVEGRVGDGWDILSWTTHLFDLTNFFFDSTPSWILAGAEHSGTRRYQHAVEDASVVLAEYPNGSQGLFITGPESPGGLFMHVRGSKGSLNIGWDNKLHWFNQEGHREEVLHSSAPSMMSPVIAELVACVDNGTGMLCGAESCAIATEIAYAVHESARTMRKVHLPLRTEFAPLELVQSRARAWLPAGEVVLFADEHFGSGGREGIVTAIQEATGRGARMVDAQNGLAEADLKGAAVLLVYHTQAEPVGLTQKVMADWVAAGKPMVVVHAGLGAYPKWEEYKKWCGRVWAWGDAPIPSEHPYEPSELKCVQGAQLPLLWRSAWLPKDEVFIKLAQTSPCRDLVTATIPQGEFPAAWINADQPNIGVWVPGHREDMWSVPALREGLIAVIQMVS